MQDLAPDDLRRAASFVVETFTPAAEADWSVGAGDVEWTCRETLDHTIDGLLWYAANLATLATSRREDLRAGRHRDPRPSIAQLLDGLDTAAHILARVVEATPSDARGYHGSGMADATGFIGMGCDETLVHGFDISLGLGLPYAPPPEVCARTVARLFPWAPDHDDPWPLLLWCNGRVALPGSARIGPGWGWWSRPLDEWNGVPYTDTWAGD